MCGTVAASKEKDLPFGKPLGGNRNKRIACPAPHGESARGEGTPLSVNFNLPVAKPQFQKKRTCLPASPFFLELLAGFEPATY